MNETPMLEKPVGIPADHTHMGVYNLQGTRVSAGTLPDLVYPQITLCMCGYVGVYHTEAQLTWSSLLGLLTDLLN